MRRETSPSVDREITLHVRVWKGWKRGQNSLLSSRRYPQLIPWAQDHKSCSARAFPARACSKVQRVWCKVSSKTLRAFPVEGVWFDIYGKATSGKHMWVTKVAWAARSSSVSHKFRRSTQPHGDWVFFIASSRKPAMIGCTGHPMSKAWGLCVLIW